MIVAMLFWAQSVLAQQNFEDRLQAYQKDLPKGCQIQTKAMKLVYACSPLQSPEDNPRFYGTLNAGEAYAAANSSNGINHCYNTLISTNRNGDLVKVSVLKDQGDTPRQRKYNFNADKDRTFGEYLFNFKDINGFCFVTDKANQGLCDNIFSKKDVPLVMKFSLNDKSARGELVAHEYRMKAAKPIEDLGQFEADEAKTMALQYASQMLAKLTTKGPGERFDAAAWKECDARRTELDDSLKKNPRPRMMSEEDAITKGRKKIADMESLGPKNVKEVKAAH